MPPVNATILIDTNAILQAHKQGCWNALIGRYSIETVEECVIETQTGFQQRRNEEQIDEAALRGQISVVHQVAAVNIAAIDLLQGPELDAGEKALWAHAITRDDKWVLCGPDRASMRFGFEQGHRDQLVSLGGLLDEIGFRPARPLPGHFEQAWLDRVLSDLALGLL